MKVGFIGLGIMGSRMAARIREGGHELVVHNRTRSAAEDLLSRGASWADASVAGKLYAMHQKEGNGDSDFTSLFKYLTEGSYGDHALSRRLPACQPKWISADAGITRKSEKASLAWSVCFSPAGIT
jgi:hypothetical protein